MCVTVSHVLLSEYCALLCPMTLCPNIVRYCVPYFPRKKLQLCICPYCAYFPFVLMFRLCIRPFCAYVPLCINMSLLCICPLSLCRYDKNVPIVKKVAGGHHSLRVSNKFSYPYLIKTKFWTFFYPIRLIPLIPAFPNTFCHFSLFWVFFFWNLKFSISRLNLRECQTLER